ncbi:MAG TPA: patatin-like phospholipase family protein [Steroidobacteraceae bacterium]|jgi:NTE family protein|nr:patatin-like phospholipase family protein [Steroidobacteraceae bacterium]
MDSTTISPTAVRKPARAAARKSHKQLVRPPFESIALLLQGGGALGAYQGGVYQALSEAHLDPDWVAGISIGAVNAALIAGNEPGVRADKLREFWRRVTRGGAFDGGALLGMTPFAPRGDLARGVVNQLSAGAALVGGVSGFFAPRFPVAWLQPPGSPEATSYYDTRPLKSTLEELVDFDRINSGETRFSVGAVNVSSGNFVYFDNTTHTIGPEHVMASGALPPGFPAVEIEGEFYWDGGLVSNTPLQWVLESEPRRDTLAFQVDLWSARGTVPRTMTEVMTRQKEIQYSSRTRNNSDRFRYTQRLRNAVAGLLDKLPDDLRNIPELAVLAPVACPKVYNLVQLIYRAKQYEGDSKDYEFSRSSMEDHWRAGYHDTVRTLRHPEVLQRPNNLEGVLTFDLSQNGRE